MVNNLHDGYSTDMMNFGMEQVSSRPFSGFVWAIILFTCKLGGKGLAPPPSGNIYFSLARVLFSSTNIQAALRCLCATGWCTHCKRYASQFVGRATKGIR